MTGLSPMLLMVCDHCARDDDWDFCETTGCAFHGHHTPTPGLKPARTREEMVEAGVLAIRDLTGEHLIGEWAIATRVLAAAGVIQSEEPGDASGTVRT